MLWQACAQPAADLLAGGFRSKGGAISLCDGTELEPTTVVRFDQAYRDYESRGVFRIGILPIGVMEGVTIESPPAETPVAEVKGGIVQVPIEKVHKSPWQPRKNMAPEALEELSLSVRERGVLQPLLVRRVEDKFELIAGERRLRAAQSAELRQVPVIIMDVSDREVMELALIENLQREDLNLIEEAEGGGGRGHRCGRLGGGADCQTQGLPRGGHRRRRTQVRGGRRGAGF